MTDRELVVWKDPDAVLDYAVDWGDEGDWLVDGDVIQTSTWTVPDGLTKGVDLHTDLVAVVWLSGGTPGGRYQITNRIVTAANRTDDRSFTIAVRHR